MVGALPVLLELERTSSRRDSSRTSRQTRMLARTVALVVKVGHGGGYSPDRFCNDLRSVTFMPGEASFRGGSTLLLPVLANLGEHIMQSPAEPNGIRAAVHAMQALPRPLQDARHQAICITGLLS